MAKRSVLRALPKNTNPLQLSAVQFTAAVLDHLDQSKDGDRIVAWCRVRDLTPPRGPFSRAAIYRWLDDGKLRGRKLGDVLLIEIASVQELLDTAEPWASAATKAQP